MANTSKVIDMITQEVVRIAHEESSFLGTIDRQYDDDFGKKGGKIGGTLRIRLPERGTVRTGRVANIQDSEEESTTLTMSTQKGFDLAFNSKEALLDLDDYMKRKVKPRVAMLVSNIEEDVLSGVTKEVYNLVGTAGTIPNDLEIFANAQAKLNQYLAPKDGQRYVQVNSLTMAKMVGVLKGLFHDSTQIKEQYREGIVGRTTMADWYANERIYRHTTGTDHTTVTVNDASIADGDTTITTAGANVTVGSVFQFANVKAVHPETKKAYSHLQDFTITAVAGNDWTFSPAYYATGAKQNVDALPVNAAAITVVGVASTTYAQDLMYHKEFATFVTGDLPLYDDSIKCSRQEFDGLSFRVWQASDIKNDECILRCDILYGYKIIRPEWAVRITS